MISEPETIYEDNYIIALNKPAGLLSIPDRFNAESPNITAILKKRIPDVIPLHRLDRYTSGVILFAKDAETHRLLSIQFEERSTEKYYLAVVDGVPNPPAGIIDAPLAESLSTRGKMLVHKRGKESNTEYSVVKDFKRFSLLSIKILTGRMHQIRVHMQYVGHPLVVDSLYGKREAFFLSELKNKKYKLSKFEEEKPLITRQPLHAQKLIINHPYSGVRLELEASIPKDIVALLNQLEKWSIKNTDKF